MIDIVIPVFNQVEYLPDALDSVLRQTVLPLNVWVIDDGSTDGSLEVANKYASGMIKVISQTNKGLASARNTGIMNAESDWILFLDADDILAENIIEVLEPLTKKTKMDVIAPSFQEFGLSQARISLMKNPTLEDFKTGNRIGYCAAIRKSALLEVGGYSPKMTWGYEDLHLWINLLTRGFKIATISDILWLYRTKEKSMITTAREHHQELLDQINKDFPTANLQF